MLTAYRLFKAKHSDTWFDGEGAYRFGGRWNSSGTRVIYAAQSLSLALLEVLVHLDSDQLLSAYSYATISFEPDEVVTVESIIDLPSEWLASPPPLRIQEIGDKWAKTQRSVVLSVPTSIVPEERNYIINVAHPKFEMLVRTDVKPIEIDRRLKSTF